MSIIGRLREKWRYRRMFRTIGESRTQRNGPPKIDTMWGEVTESMRRQAAENLYLDHEKRAAVEELLAAQLGSAEAGKAECRRRYPEAFRDEAS